MGGYVLEDFGPQPAGASHSEEERALAGYQSALAEVDAGRPAQAAKALEGLAANCPPAVRLAVSNALAAARALSGDSAGALALWTELVRSAGARPRAYLEYNLGLLAFATGDRAVARRHLESALSGHSGFRQARRVLDGWAFGR
jgi:predicted Zn-dependent protease